MSSGVGHAVDRLLVPLHDRGPTGADEGKAKDGGCSESSCDEVEQTAIRGRRRPSRHVAGPVVAD
jgi:hypothetical protein